MYFQDINLKQPMPRYFSKITGLKEEQRKVLLTSRKKTKQQHCQDFLTETLYVGRKWHNILRSEKMRACT